MTALLDRAAAAATRGEAPEWSLLSVVHEWLSGLALETSSGGSDGSVWRVWWGMPDERSGLPTARVARVGRDPAVLSPTFGHVFVPDALRSDPAWVEGQARRMLRVPVPAVPAAPELIPAPAGGVDAAASPSQPGSGDPIYGESVPLIVAGVQPPPPAPPAPLRAAALLRPVSRVDRSPTFPLVRGPTNQCHVRVRLEGFEPPTF